MPVTYHHAEKATVSSGNKYNLRALYFDYKEKDFYHGHRKWSLNAPKQGRRFCEPVSAGRRYTGVNLRLSFMRIFSDHSQYRIIKYFSTFLSCCESCPVSSAGVDLSGRRISRSSNLPRQGATSPSLHQIPPFSISPRPGSEPKNTSSKQSLLPCHAFVILPAFTSGQIGRAHV